MGIKNLIDKYTKIRNLLPEERRKEALKMANDGLALTRSDIQNEGKGYDGQKFPLYSKNIFPYWLIRADSFNASNKVKKFKKRAAKKSKKDPAEGSYHAFRKAYGVPTDKRTLTLDGDMWKAVFAEVESHDEFVTTIVIQAKDEENQNKIGWNSNKLGGSILRWSEPTKKIIRELNQERLNKLK